MTVQEQIDDLYRAVWFAIGIATSACAVSALTGAAVGTAPLETPTAADPRLPT